MGAPEVLEVINSFRTPIFIPVVRVKQVRFCGKLSPEPSPQVDVESEAHEEREIVKQEYFEPEESKPIKQERSPSPDPDQKPTPSASTPTLERENTNPRSQQKSEQGL